MVITLTTKPIYSRRLVPIFARLDLSDSIWVQLLGIKTNFIELFQQTDMAEQAKHWVLLSLDHFDHHWDLLHYAVVLRGAFTFTPELLEPSNFEGIVKTFRKVTTDVQCFLFGSPNVLRDDIRDITLNMISLKQCHKQLTRLLSATNVWCGDLKGHDLENLVGFLGMRPGHELFLLCQSMFMRSFTIDYLDVSF
jgi:hypothetical protein